MPIIRDHQDREGVLVFDSQMDDQHSNYDSKHLDVLASAESRHFWFQCRRDRICQTFHHYVEKGARILEIGTGTGFVAEQLIRQGFTIDVADVHFNGLLYAKTKGIKNLYQFDLHCPPFEEEFDVICLFDVLEHLADEKKGLECIKKMLRPGGMVIMTVPAHQWLWSREDIIAGHEKRYTRKHLKGLFRSLALEPVQLRYFFSAIVPLLLLRRWIMRDTSRPLRDDERLEITLHPILNRILHFLTKTEFLLDRFLPNLAGGSLLGIAKKK